MAAGRFGGDCELGLGDEVGRCFARPDVDNAMRFIGEEQVPYTERYVPLTVRRGDLSLLLGAVIRKRDQGTSAHLSYAYSVHCVGMESRRGAGCNTSVSTLLNMRLTAASCWPRRDWSTPPTIFDKNLGNI